MDYKLLEAQVQGRSQQAAPPHFGVELARTSHSSRMVSRVNRLFNSRVKLTNLSTKGKWDLTSNKEG